MIPGLHSLRARREDFALNGGIGTCRLAHQRRLADITADGMAGFAVVTDAARHVMGQIAHRPLARRTRSWNR
jgi:hypothetical protein